MGRGSAPPVSSLQAAARAGERAGSSPFSQDSQRAPATRPSSDYLWPLVCRREEGRVPGQGCRRLRIPRATRQQGCGTDSCGFSPSSASDSGQHCVCWLDSHRTPLSDGQQG